MNSSPIVVAAASDWSTSTYLGIEVQQYIGIGILAAIAVVSHFVLLRVIAVVLRRRYSGDELAFWNNERKLLNRGLLLLSIGVTLLVGFPTLGFGPAVENLVNKGTSLISDFGVILLAYRAIDVVVDALGRRATETETKLDDTLVPLLRTTMRLFVTVVGALIVLQNLDVDVSSLVTGLGLGGLAVALATQGTVRNMFGGVTFFADKPFEVGDWVVVDGIEGTVETVGFRSTRVRTFYNSLVSVPNGNLIDAGIDNMGRRRWRRYKTTLGVGYHTTPDQMQAFVEGIRAIIQANPGMRQDYYIVEFHGFGATSLDVLVYCFIDAADWNEELRTRHVFNLDIMRLAESLQVDFAFPTQTLHIAQMPGRPQQLPDVPDRERLRAIVDSYGPNGANGQRTDHPIAASHDSNLDGPYSHGDDG